MNNKTASTLLVIFLLMIVSGLLIYYLYLKPETFNGNDSTTTTTIPVNTCPPPVAPLPASIISSYYGVGFNIYPVNKTTAESVTNAKIDSQDSNIPTFLIEHIPVVYNGTMGSMYAVTEGQLTLKLRNDTDQDQWWSFIKRKDTNNNTYYSIIPFNSIKNKPQLVLQYENGTLALRVANKDFINQKWLTSTNKITRGIPALNYSPASLFTPEFNAYASSSGGSTTSANLSQQNNQQVTDVINLIKSNIQQYIDTVSHSQGSGSGSGTGGSGLLPPVSSSSLGNKEMPLNINVNLGGTSGSGGSSVSSFANITGTTTSSDLMSLLNKYENAQSATVNPNLLYSGTDLQTALQTNEGCSTLNIRDYTSNRVSTCNCKL